LSRDENVRFFLQKIPETGTIEQHDPIIVVVQFEGIGDAVQCRSGIGLVESQSGQVEFDAMHNESGESRQIHSRPSEVPIVGFEVSSSISGPFVSFLFLQIFSARAVTILKVCCVCFFLIFVLFKILLLFRTTLTSLLVCFKTNQISVYFFV
jgi:hypothetical protein